MVSRQQSKKEATKVLILEIASKMFAEIGLEKTTINEIVEKANLAKGTFYYHFKSKEDLLRELEYQEFKKISDEFKQEINLNFSSIEAIEIIADKFAEWSVNNPERLKMHLSHRLNFDKVDKASYKPSPFSDLLSYVISLAQKEGVITTHVSALELAHILGMMLIQSQLYWIAFPEDYSIKDGFKKVLSIFFYGAVKEKKNDK